MAFALCASKFHLLILLPAALIAQRRWGVIRGLAAGAAALVGLSFVAGGWTWPSDYANVLLLGKLHPEPHIMPNLHGLLAGLPAATAWEIAGGMAAIAAVAYAARRGDFAFGLAAASFGSLIVSRHCYVSDLTILLPGLLGTARSLTTPLAKFLALSWLSPILPLILVTGRPLSYAAQAALPLALAAYVMSGMKSSNQSEEPAPAVADVAA